MWNKNITNLYLSPSQLQGSYHISKRYTLGATAGLELLSEMLGKIQGKEGIVAASPKLEAWSASLLKPMIKVYTEPSQRDRRQDGHQRTAL